MRIVDVAARSARSLKSAKGRTILTALAIAVGGFTLTMTLAAGNGIRTYTSRLIASNFDPAELLVGRDPEVANTGAPKTELKEYDENTSAIAFGGGNGGSIVIKQTTNEDVTQIEQLSYVERVRPEYQLSARYITRSGQKKYVPSVIVYNPAQRPELIAGSLPNEDDIGKGNALLPESYLSVLGFSSAEDAIGKQIQINFQQQFSLNNASEILEQLQTGGSLGIGDLKNAAPPDKTYNFTVAGVTKRSATSMVLAMPSVSINGTDGKEVNEFTSQGTPGYGKYLYVSVKVKDGEDETKLLAAKADLESQGFYVMSSKEIQKTITQAVNVLQILVGVFGVITIIASIFGIVNTQYISVLERTREIGLMKSLGMRNRDVRRLFMIEAGWIGFIGGALGAASAVLIGVSLNPAIDAKLNLGNKLLMFRADQIIILIGALILVAIFAGYLPARKAAKLDPVEALRTE